MKYKKSFWIEFAIVAAILVGGTYVRFAGLTALPPGLYPDEAMNTTDGLTAAEAGTWPLFYENNNGREGLYISILGYLLHWFGPSLWIVRFWPALIGALTLPAVYWIGRRVSGKFGAIMALGLMAFSYWHLNFSRIGFRAILMVFALAWAFAFLTEGFWRIVRRNAPRRVPTWTWFAVAGLFFGLSLHTYIAVRIAPAVVAAFFLMMLLFFASYWKDILKYAVITVFFTLLTAAPMLYDFVAHPIHFTGRTSNVSVLSSPNLVQSLGKSVGLTLASFVGYGDQNWRHNYPYLPIVLPVWGIILFIGVGWGVVRFFKEIIKKIGSKPTKARYMNWETAAWVFLISWWGLLLAPSFMTNEGLPHALRSIGAIPPTFLLVGFMINKWAKTPKAKIIYVSLMVISGIISVFAYFYMWGRSPQAFNAFDFRTSSIGIYLRDTIPQDPKTNYYFITNQENFLTDNGTPVAIEPVRFFTWRYHDRLNFVLPENFDPEMMKLPAKVFFLQNQDDIIRELQKRYPNGIFRDVSAGGDDIPVDFSVRSIPNDILAKQKYSAEFRPANEECFLQTSVPVYEHFIFFEIQ